MDILSQLLVLIVHCDTVPDTLRHVLVVELVEDAITAKDNKVMLPLNLECLDIRLADDHFRISSSEIKFSFGIAEGP